MKSLLKKIAVLTAVVLVLGLTACDKNEGNGGSEEVNILAICDIQSDPLAFTGELVLNGIYAGRFAEDTTDEDIFYIKDKKELLFCKNLYCDAYRLPAVYVGDGEIPEIADEVNITGSWGVRDESDVFEITKIEVLRNVKHVLVLTDWN
ncbi:MAG: hypothetical protein FWF82_02670 [Oscillospiraceae bacterium]|nr:hypothetical protein [Oscillospiraceae bacterium]